MKSYGVAYLAQHIGALVTVQRLNADWTRCSISRISPMLGRHDEGPRRDAPPRNRLFEESVKMRREPRWYMQSSHMGCT